MSLLFTLSLPLYQIDAEFDLTKARSSTTSYQKNRAALRKKGKDSAIQTNLHIQYVSGG